jgi:hypothetical protein
VGLSSDQHDQAEEARALSVWVNELRHAVRIRDDRRVALFATGRRVGSSNAAPAQVGHCVQAVTADASEHSHYRWSDQWGPLEGAAVLASYQVGCPS